MLRYLIVLIIPILCFGTPKVDELTKARQSAEKTIAYSDSCLKLTKGDLLFVIRYVPEKDSCKHTGWLLYITPCSCTGDSLTLIPAKYVLDIYYFSPTEIVKPEWGLQGVTGTSYYNSTVCKKEWKKIATLEISDIEDLNQWLAELGL